MTASDVALLLVLAELQKPSKKSFCPVKSIAHKQHVPSLRVHFFVLSFAFMKYFSFLASPSLLPVKHLYQSCTPILQIDI